jgi:hypothetical protein
LKSTKSCSPDFRSSFATPRTPATLIAAEDAVAPAPCYLPGMRYLRGPSIPGFLLALILGLGLLLPEAVHGLAHHHAAEHHAASAAPHSHEHPGAALTGDDHAGDHPHLESLARPSAKPGLARALVVQSTVHALDGLSEERPLALPLAAQPLTAGREHGPPPPARAPPLV